MRRRTLSFGGVQIPLSSRAGRQKGAKFIQAPSEKRAQPEMSVLFVRDSQVFTNSLEVAVRAIALFGGLLSAVFDGLPTSASRLL
jgi:hypothetical protein